jgi:hypothetical protein
VNLPLANFREPEWYNIEAFDQMGYYQLERVKELESKLDELQPSKQERTWIAQHAAWLLDKARQEMWKTGTLTKFPITYRIAAYEECIARKSNELPCRNPEFLPVDQLPRHMSADTAKFAGNIKRFGSHITIPRAPSPAHFKFITKRNGEIDTVYTEYGFQQKAKLAGWYDNDETRRVTRQMSQRNNQATIIGKADERATAQRRGNLVIPDPILIDSDDKDPTPSTSGSTDDQA